MGIRPIDPTGQDPQTCRQQEPVEAEPQGALRQEVPVQRGERRHGQQERRRISIIVENEGAVRVLDVCGAGRESVRAVPPSRLVEIFDVGTAQRVRADIGRETAVGLDELLAR